MNNCAILRLEGQLLRSMIFIKRSWTECTMADESGCLMLLEIRIFPFLDILEICWKFAKSTGNCVTVLVTLFDSSSLM